MNAAKIKSKKGGKKVLSKNKPVSAFQKVNIDMINKGVASVSIISLILQMFIAGAFLGSIVSFVPRVFAESEALGTCNWEEWIKIDGSFQLQSRTDFGVTEAYCDTKSFEFHPSDFIPDIPPVVVSEALGTCNWEEWIMVGRSNQLQSRTDFGVTEAYCDTKSFEFHPSVFTPDPTPTPTLTPTPTETPTPTPAIDATSTPTPTPTPTSDPDTTPTPSPIPEITPTPTPIPTVEPTIEPTVTPTPEPTPILIEPTPTPVEPTPTSTPEATPIEIPDPTLTPTSTPSPTTAPAPTSTPEPDETSTSDVSPTPTPTPTLTPGSNPDPDIIPTPSPTSALISENNTSTGGSGGGGGFAGLTISNEFVKVNEGSVTITWTTSQFSTSQVVYDTVENKFDPNGLAPKYGYSDFKIGDDSGLEKVTFHSVTLTDIVPGITYYFRTISLGSFAISKEHSFVAAGSTSSSVSSTNSNISSSDKNPVSNSKTSPFVSESASPIVQNAFYSAQSSSQLPNTPESAELSVVDYLKSKGRPSDFESRAVLAGQKGIENYTGTMEQNIKFLALLKENSSEGILPAISENNPVDPLEKAGVQENPENKDIPAKTTENPAVKNEEIPAGAASVAGSSIGVFDQPALVNIAVLLAILVFVVHLGKKYRDKIRIKIKI